jgi:DNA mismatch endonuclease (patch repair protein)
MKVRRLVHRMGFRYRTHVRTLPGKPDLAFLGRRKAIFVNGCFWHQHPRCADATMPKSRRTFWQEKLSRNVERDREQLDALRSMGWSCLTIWECETNQIESLTPIIAQFLGPTRLSTTKRAGTTE